MADQGRSSQYGTATPDCTPPSSPRDSSPDSSQRSKRDEQLDAARRNEINILTQLRHDNIIGYTKELDGSVKLEKLDTTLESRLKEPTQMTLFQKLSVARDLAQAITYLHGLTRPILHLNIQPSSVQLGSRVGILAKLSEFGVACHADELRAGPLGGPLGSTPANSSNPQTSPDSNSDSHHSSPSRNPTSTSSSTTTTTPHHGLQEQDTYKAGRATPNGSPHSTSSTASTSTPSSTSSVSSSSSSSSSHSPNTQSANGTRPPAPTAQVMAAMRGAPLYNPPEALRGEPYTEAADVYSFGLTMTELILGSSPFIAVRSLAGLMAAIEAPIIFPDDLPPHIADLLSRCRAVDPRRRPHFSEILVTLNEMFVPVFVHENIDWARQFWMDYFPGSISVRWSDFCGQLIRCLKLPTTPNEVTFRGVQKSKDNAAGIATRRLHCLKQLMFPGLSDDSDFLKSINLWIDIDKYGHIMGTFSDENTRLDSLLETVANLIETRWFHGDATGSSGPHRLAPDTFLIRLSAPAQNSLKPPNCWFTFSLKTSAGNFVRETRIQRQPGRSECLLANSSRETFSSLFQLAETKGKPYGLAPVPSFLHSTLHPVSAEYTTDEEDM